MRRFLNEHPHAAGIAIILGSILAGIVIVGVLHLVAEARHTETVERCRTVTRVLACQGDGCRVEVVDDQGGEPVRTSAAPPVAEGDRYCVIRIRRLGTWTEVRRENP